MIAVNMKQLTRKVKQIECALVQGKPHVIACTRERKIERTNEENEVKRDKISSENTRENYVW